MLKMMGFKEGEALGRAPSNTDDGATDGRRTEPINVSLKEDRGGIGLDTEKKRKFREEVELEVKKVKVDQEDYRERMRREREEKRMEGQLYGAMKVAEGLDEEDENIRMAEEKSTDDNHKIARRLRKTNVLWRTLSHKRAVKERDRRARADMLQSISRLPTYVDDEADEQDKLAYGEEEEEVEEEDEELNEFQALPVDEKLQKVVGFLRERWRYCFWCKFRYEDEGMEGCPGILEEDHD
jgi:Domain of unknown function (DUF4187)/G-patch domain